MAPHNADFSVAFGDTRHRQLASVAVSVDNTRRDGVRWVYRRVRSREYRVANGLSKSRFLTVQEVADVMRVSSMTVYRLIKSGELAAVRVGRSFRVSDVDVDQYLAARYTQAG